MTINAQQVRDIAQGFEEIQQGLHGLAIKAAQAAKNAESLARELDREEAHRAQLAGPLGAFTGLVKGSTPVPAPMPSYPAGPTVINVPADTRLNVASPAAQKAANLTDEARKLINTGASYDRAIAILTAKYPTREREHIRRAVGRANGGRS